MVNFRLLRLASVISSSASHSSSAIGFSSITFLPALQAVARDRIVVGLRRGRDEHHRDVVVLDDVLVVERRGRGPVARLQLGEPVRLDVADVQLVAPAPCATAFPPACRRPNPRRLHRLRLSSRCPFPSGFSLDRPHKDHAGAASAIAVFRAALTAEHLARRTADRPRPVPGRPPRAAAAASRPTAPASPARRAAGRTRSRC